MQYTSPGFFCTAFARTRLCVARLLATALFGLAAISPIAPIAHAQTAAAPGTTTASDTHIDLRDALPQHKLLGKSRLTVWGFEVYDASLWVTPGFKADKLAALPFALELAYLRDFTSLDIAKRSIAEMRRLATISAAQADTWTSAMLRVIPNVKKGDRIMGIYKPGAGATFLVNGKPTGEITDGEFARLFFGIWLSPKTSEPTVRSALLAGAV